MKNCLTLGLLLLPLLTICQYKSAIDITAGIYMSTSSLRSGDPNIDPQLRELTRLEESTNFSIGAYYNRKINLRFYLRSGVQFAGYGWKYPKNSGLVWGQTTGPETFWWIEPTEDRTQITEIQVVLNDLFVGLPILLRYELLLRRFTPYIELGMTPSLYLHTRVKQITNIGTDSRSFDIPFEAHNTFQLVTNLSLGIQYLITTDFQLFCQPTLMYHVTNSWDSETSEHYYNLGIDVGVRRGLN